MIAIRFVMSSEPPKISQRPSSPTESKLKVPKFGVEAPAKAGVGSFAATGETIQYSESVTQKATELLAKYDRNGNGILDEGEISRMSWGNPRPSANDTNGDGRLTFTEIQGRYHDREMAEQRSEKSYRDNERSSGEERSGDDRRGRGRNGRGDSYSRDSRDSYRDSGSSRESSRESSSDRGDDSSSGRSETNTSSSDPEKAKLDRSKNYVEKYFAGRDKDKNGVLEGAELKTLNARSLSKYDTSGDGKITKDEMMDVIAPPESGKPKSVNTKASTPGRPTTPSNRGKTQSRSRTSGAFKAVDKNKDELVQMHEYSETWTQEQLDDFVKKDKNGDGVITADEWR